MNNKHRESQWNGIGDELGIRLANAKNSIFFIVFMLLLITLGGLGIWIPPLRETAVKLLNSESLFTYAGPILAMLLTEYFIQAQRSKLAVLGFGFGILSSIFISLGYYLSPHDRNFWTILGTFFTLILTVFVSANDKKFDEDEMTEADMTSPTGADVVSVANIKNK